MKDLASSSFSGRNVKVIPFWDHQSLSTVWNKGLLGNALEGIFIEIWRRVIPSWGSGRSSTRFTASSQVEPVHILAEIAAWRATREANFAF
jgi:hypothetical protein